MHAATGTCVECLGHFLLALMGPSLTLSAMLFRLTYFCAAALQIAALQQQFGPAQQLLEQHLEHAQAVGGCIGCTSASAAAAQLVWPLA